MIVRSSSGVRGKFLECDTIEALDAMRAAIEHDISTRPDEQLSVSAERAGKVRWIWEQTIKEQYALRLTEIGAA